jgi:hypothetical protein
MQRAKEKLPKRFFVVMSLVSLLMLVGCIDLMAFFVGQRFLAFENELGTALQDESQLHSWPAKLVGVCGAVFGHMVPALKAHTAVVTDVSVALKHFLGQVPCLLFAQTFCDEHLASARMHSDGDLKFFFCEWCEVHAATLIA